MSDEKKAESATPAGEDQDEVLADAMRVIAEKVARAHEFEPILSAVAVPYDVLWAIHERYVLASQSSLRPQEGADTDIHDRRMPPAPNLAAMNMKSDPAVLAALDQAAQPSPAAKVADALAELSDAECDRILDARKETHRRRIGRLWERSLLREGYRAAHRKGSA